MKVSFTVKDCKSAEECETQARRILDEFAGGRDYTLPEIVARPDIEITTHGQRPVLVSWEASVEAEVF